MDITTTANEFGDFDPIRMDQLPVTARDGHGAPTPTVRELADILRSLPEQFQDLPVARYCDEGVAGISCRLHYERESGDSWTPHVGLW